MRIPVFISFIVEYDFRGSRLLRPKLGGSKGFTLSRCFRCGEGEHGTDDLRYTSLSVYRDAGSKTVHSVPLAVSGIKVATDSEGPLVTKQTGTT